MPNKQKDEPPEIDPDLYWIPNGYNQLVYNNPEFAYRVRLLGESKQLVVNLYKQLKKMELLISSKFISVCTFLQLNRDHVLSLHTKRDKIKRLHENAIHRQNRRETQHDIMYKLLK